MEIRNKREGTMPGLAKKEKKTKNIGYLPNPYKTTEKKEDYYIEDVTICNLYEIAKKISDKNKIYYQKGKKLEQINKQNTYIITMTESSFYCKESNGHKYYIGYDESNYKTYTFLYIKDTIYHLIPESNQKETYTLSNKICTINKYLEIIDNKINQTTQQNTKKKKKR